MSVVGFDVGNFRSKIAIARRGGIDVAVNDVSNRETPTVVSFNGEERFIGEAATTQITSNPKNTISNLLRLVGRQANDEAVERSRETTTCLLEADDSGKCVAKVYYGGDQVSFATERVMGMMLSDLRSTAENELKTKVVDCVLAVPLGFGMAERQAMLDSAKVIGLNPLCLINNTTAAALQWGFYKTPEEGQIVCFVDCGHMSLDLAIVKFQKDKLTVIGSWSTSEVSSSTMDQAIANHLRQYFIETYKLDAFSRPRAKVRLFQACEKAKRVLSANPVCPVNIECLMEDTDVRAQIKREDLEELLKPNLASIETAITKALESAEITADQVNNIEVVGGMSWVPIVTTTISNCFGGKTVGRTLNAQDAIAKGACLMCAMLSVTLKVRDYKVLDVSQKDVFAKWPVPASGKDKEVCIFKKGSELGTRKMLSFQRDEPFELSVFVEGGLELMKVSVSGMKTAAERAEAFKLQQKEKGLEETGEGAPPNKIKVVFDLTNSGLISLVGAHVVEEYEVATTVPKPTEEAAAAAPAAAPAAEATTTEAPSSEQTETSDQQKQPEENKEKDGDTPMGEAAAPAEDAAKDQEQTEVVWKKKTRKVQLNAAPANLIGWSATRLEAEATEEWKLVARDREIKATQDARNELESFVYDMRDKLSQSYSRLTGFMEETSRTAFVEQLNATETWLYEEEAEDASKATFVDKLTELKAISEPVVVRHREYESRDDAKRHVTSAIEDNRTFLATTDARYDHITQEERDVLLGKCQAVEVQLNEMLEKLSAQEKTADPLFTCHVIRQLAEELNKEVQTTMNKPKPKPAKPEEGDKQTEQPTAAEDTADKPAEQEQQDAPKPEEQEEQQQQAEGQQQEQDEAKRMDLD